MTEPPRSPTDLFFCSSGGQSPKSVSLSSSQHVSRLGSFCWLHGVICVLAFLASGRGGEGGLPSPLASDLISLQPRAFIVLPPDTSWTFLFPSVRTYMITHSHPDNPGRFPHLQILNLITSTKALLLCQVGFVGFRD